MGPLLATAVGVGIFGGIATWFYLFVGTILIWAGFVSWACFFAIGGDNEALKTTITCNTFGVFVASITAIIILAVPAASILTLPVWAGIMVAVSVVSYILASAVPVFSSVPATTLGYAAAFAYLSQTPDMFSLPALTSLTVQNSMVVVTLSMILGAVFGYGSGKLAGALTKAEG